MFLHAHAQAGSAYTLQRHLWDKTELKPGFPHSIGCLVYKKLQRPPLSVYTQQKSLLPISPHYP